MRQRPLECIDARQVDPLPEIVGVQGPCSEMLHNWKGEGPEIPCLSPARNHPGPGNVICSKAVSQTAGPVDWLDLRIGYRPLSFYICLVQSLSCHLLLKNACGIQPPKGYRIHLGEGRFFSCQKGLLPVDFGGHIYVSTSGLWKG